MANQNFNEKSQSSMSSSASNTMRDTTNTIRDTARESMRTVRDTADRVKSNVSEKLDQIDSEEMMNRATETATEFYDTAQGWVRDNSRMLYMVGGLLAVGIVGYMVGRTFMNRSPDIENY